MNFSKTHSSRILKNAFAWTAALCAVNAFSQSVSPEIKSKLDTKIKQLQFLSTDPTVVAAVKAHNSSQSPQEKAMTNEKWAALTVVDPLVKSFTKNSLGTYLKTKKDDSILECFVSGADGSKVAFLSKPTSWSHANHDKHKMPMSNKTFIGPVALDTSTGQTLLQVGLPVLDGGKPIGSIVVGLSVDTAK